MTARAGAFDSSGTLHFRRPGLEETPSVLGIIPSKRPRPALEGPTSVSAHNAPMAAGRDCVELFPSASCRIDCVT